jgi:hypothetical protein
MGNIQVIYGAGFDTANAPHKVKFRESILSLQEKMQKMIADGEMEDRLPDCTLTHYFSPKSEDYGCSVYARQMFIPQGTLIVGKIHRHQHLNFIIKGKVSVATEFGKKFFEAPCGFLSEVGLKRAVIAEEDTVWMTVHMTKHNGEQYLDEIEAELIAPAYSEMGFIDSMAQLERISS